MALSIISYYSERFHKGYDSTAIKPLRLPAWFIMLFFSCFFLFRKPQGLPRY